MPAFDVQKVAEQLHESGAINLDTPVRNLLKPEGIGLTDPGSLAASYVAVWEHYAVVCGLQDISIAELSQFASALRSDISRGGPQ